MDINTIRTPCKDITMFSEHCNIDENVEYALHWLLFSDFEVEDKISQAAEGTLGQSMKNSFPVVLGCVPTSSPWRHQTLNQNIEAFWIFYLRQVEGDWYLIIEKLPPYDFQLFKHFKRYKMYLWACKFAHKQKEQKESIFIARVKSDVFVDFRSSYWCPTLLHLAWCLHTKLYKIAWNFLEDLN